MSALAERNGSLRGHEVLGTAFRDGREVTLVRIDFEHGEVYRAYVWDPDEEEKLLGVSVRGLDHILWRVVARVCESEISRPSGSSWAAVGR